MDERRFNYCLKNIHEEKCFTELYEFYYNRIVHHLKRKFNIRSLSEDVAQESMTKSEESFWTFIEEFVNVK